MKPNLTLLIALILILEGSTVFATEEQNSICFECHSDRDLKKEKEGKKISLFINNDIFKKSVHKGVACIGCHDDINIDDIPHSENLKKVDCGKCHKTATENYRQSLHGQALKNGKYLAPDCGVCHGKHDIISSKNEKAKTYVFNIPALCGQCHKEGTKVSSLKGMSEKHMVEDYSESIHGNGLFKRGLIVSATCTSCHTSHNILQHENSSSSINRNNIRKTCMKCHKLIEKVHQKVINGELWEKKPEDVPICIDCHKPHKVQQVFYERSYNDQLCNSCHFEGNPIPAKNGRELKLDPEHVKNSVHKGITCIKCHKNIDPASKPICKDSGKVDCSMCHAEAVTQFKKGVHGRLFDEGSKIAPYCTDCHTSHEIKSKKDQTSPTFSRKVPELCGKCHREGNRAAMAYKGKEHNIIENYSESIHGKGLLQSGLLVTSTCIDCHTPHMELPAKDENSTVNKHNIAKTCSKCHLGIYEKFKNSVHSELVTKTDKKLPVCSDCHLSHTIGRIDKDDFRQTIINQCGKCHENESNTFFDTFHGKVSKLGMAKTARCHDCHGAHDILPTSNPQSHLSRDKVVETCKKCHPNSNRKFVGYLTHATHHNKEKYPYLYYSFWFMTFLLLGTFAFFGLHTILWLPRNIKETFKRSKKSHDTTKYVQRFDLYSRFVHLLVITSFLSLAITGMTLKFSSVGIFQTISRVLGGFVITGFIHRVAAAITFIYFLLHISQLVYTKLKNKTPVLKMFQGDNSLMFQPRDLIEFFQTIKWFLGFGERPQYGRWTYWEKFDYFAVFWGVAVIGFSGLMLWFSEFFTNALLVPGWILNIATIIHSDEALLATGFIFTIHFFNSHFRPDKFPMDMVIFTGRMPLEEFITDRPRQYKALVDSGKLEQSIVPPPERWVSILGRIFGFIFLFTGIFTILAVIYSMLFLYQ